MSPRFRSSATTFFLLAVLLTTQAGVFVFPREAKAIPVGVVASVPDAIKFAFDKISEVIKKGLTVGFTQMLNRALVTFTANVAQKAAEGLAEGGTGGKPLFKTADLKDAMKNAADGAAGDFIDQLGKGLIGQSVCSPPELKLGLTLNMLEAIAPPKPSCSFRDMQKKWGALNEKGGLLNQADLSKFLTVGLNPQQTEIGQALDAIINFEEARRKAEEAEARKHAPSEFDRVVNPISKTTKTPSAYIEEYGKTAQVNIPQEGNKSILEPTGDIWTDWAKVGAGVFITTFTQKYFTRLLQGLFNVQEKQRDITLPGGGTATAGGDFRASSGVSTVALNTTGGEYDVLSDFTTCPEDPKARSIYNCVIDQSFAQAVRSEMSIYDAMNPDPSQKKDPLLRPSWPFGYFGTSVDQEPEYNQGYSYSNMKKLRRMRIIPVGWELAAELVKEIGSTSGIRTLQDVTGCFNKNTGACAPFYKLVDPDWILKAPIYNCRLKAPGQLIQAGTDSRQEYCVDVQDCVVTNDDGNGCQAWGYCTQERNVWRFPGRSCPAQYNTCQQFSRESDGKVVSYLRNTLNFCTANAAGCTRYSADRRNEIWTDANLRFLNKTAGTCTPDVAGCTKFLTVSGTTVDPLTKKLVDVTSAAYASVQAAVNDSDSGKKVYSKYGIVAPPVYLKGTRTSCTVDDVGCELYTPTEDDPSIPAVITSSNTCPRECVGYDSYNELATSSSVARSVYLIPGKARTCNAESIGCAEFTNLDEVARKGEAREYFTFLRQCQKPSTDSKSYFTWVGTETTGFQLQTHLLKSEQPNGTGAPCTNRRLSDKTCQPDNPQNTGVCLPADVATNPDCREFYDEQGTISYRLYSHTILSDEKCTMYRRTIDATDTDAENNCTGSGGLWEGAPKNECTYQAFPPENRTCSAATVGCREYRGTRGNDIRIVLNETFEDNSRPSNWSVGDPSADSTRATGHSLSVTADTTLTLKKGDVDRLRTYRIDFWAKGSESLKVNFDLGAGRNSYEQNPSFTLGSSWLPYTVGPISVTDAQARDAQARITFTASPSFFLDNVRIKEMRDNFYLIKDSWTNPAACGTTIVPIQNGCRAYTDRADQPKYFKSVSRICEEKVVGCTLMIDTKNSASPYVQTFNTNALPTEDDITVPPDAKVYVVDDPAKYCAVEQQGCVALGDPRSIDPFNTFPVRRCKSADPNFNNKGCDVTPGVTEAACKASKGICEDTTTKYLLDNPDKYSTTLCTAPDIGCDIYKAAGGGTEAFRDPGDNTCDWRRVPGTSSFRFGWFKTTTPLSATEPDCYTSTYGPDLPPLLDGSDAPIAPGGARYVRTCTPENNRCTAFLDPQDHTVSAYPAGRPYFAIDDGSLNSARGEPNGTASIKKGYALFLNTNLLQAGAVERKYNSVTTYENSAAATTAGKDDAVTPVLCSKVCLVGDSGKLGQACAEPADCGANGQCGYKMKNIRVNTATGTTTVAVPECDANDLLKVKHDRTCAEWLACKGSVQVYDKKSQTTRDVCYQIGSCTEPSSTNATECGAWNDQDPKKNTPLTRELYQDPNRDTTFSGREYSGYSIPYRYPVTNFQQLSYNTDTATGQPIDFRLSNLVMKKDTNNNPQTCNPQSLAPCGAGQDVKCIISGDRLGQTDSGICYEDKGVGVLSGTQTSLGALQKDCRAYPRADAPFPPSVAISWQDDNPQYCVSGKKENDGKECGNDSAKGQISNAQCADEKDAQGVGGVCLTITARPKEKKEGFQQANVAQPFLSKGDTAAQCSYKRATYTDGTTLFFDTEQNESNIASIRYKTMENQTEEDQFKLRSISREYGLQGYCLEEDTKTGRDGDETKHPCFTWFPTDLVQGEVDVNNTFTEAGYIAEPDRRFYCVESSMFVNRVTTSKSNCSDISQESIKNNSPWSIIERYYTLQRSGCSNSQHRYWLEPINPGWYVVSSTDQVKLKFEWADFQWAYTEEAKTVCTKLALITDPTSGASLGWTERLKGQNTEPRRTYTVPAPLNYTIDNPNTPASPYGSVDAGIIEIQAGEPFSVCSGGAKAKNSCITLEDKIACTDGGGTCSPLIKRTETPNAGSPYAQGSEVYDPTAIDRLKTIFARGFGIWDWSDTDTAYKPMLGTFAPKYAWDFAGPTNAKAAGPEVRAAVYNSTTKTYSRGDRGVTVDTISSQDVKTRGSSRPIALKFYAYNANGEQMPLRRVMVDWGDGTPLFVSPSASLKNHKNQCQRFCSYSVSYDGLPTLIHDVDSAPFDSAKAGARIACTAATETQKCTTSRASGVAIKCVDPTTKVAVSGATVGVCDRSPIKCSADSDCKLSGFCNLDVDSDPKTGECRYKRKACDDDTKCGNTQLYCYGGSKHGLGCTSNSACPKVNPADTNETTPECKSFCRVENFGDTPQACVQDEVGGAPGYFIYTHAYQCKNPATLPVCDATRTTNCRGTVDGLPSCIFVPKVQVLDNWGWCNGSCEANDRGCYNNVASTPINAACDPPSLNNLSQDYSKAWTPFTNRIILQQVQ